MITVKEWHKVGHKTWEQKCVYPVDSTEHATWLISIISNTDWYKKREGTVFFSTHEEKE